MANAKRDGRARITIMRIVSDGRRCHTRLPDTSMSMEERKYGVSERNDRDYYERRAEHHLDLASRTDDIEIKTRHLDRAARHATLASLCGDVPVCPLEVSGKHEGVEGAPTHLPEAG